MQAPGLQQGMIDQNVILGVITGDLGTIGAKLPWADESIKVAFGVENRHDSMINTPDDLQAQALLSGSGGATIGIQGSTNVNDYLHGSERSAGAGQDGRRAAVVRHWRIATPTTARASRPTPTSSVRDWAPVEDVRFRASYQRAVRAPNIVELFTAQGFNLFDIDGDPCGEGVRRARRTRPAMRACLATGVPAAVLRTSALDSPAGQYNFLQGGNTDARAGNFGYGTPTASCSRRASRRA